MTNKSATIIFFGNERLTSGLKTTDAPVLNGLIERGYNIAAVVSHHTDGKSRNNRTLEVAEIARKHNIPLLLPNRPAECLEKLSELSADVAVLVAYGRIIPQSIIDLFPTGIINIHPSLLPKYRGPTPIETAIAEGDTETGVSIMQLTSGMDEGDIYAQSVVPLSGAETKFELYEILSKKAAELLFDILPGILDGTLKPTPQNNNEATYCKLLNKSDAELDLAKLSADQAERLVRAHLGFPKSKIKIGEIPIIITKAHVSSEQKTPLDLLCQDGEFLSVDELIAPSGRTMDQSAFLRGYSIT